MFQQITAQSPDNVDQFCEIFGPGNLTGTQSLLLTYYYHALKQQGSKTLRETIQTTISHMRDMFGQTFGLKKIRAARQALASKGRITMRYTGRETEIIIVDLRDNKPPSIWDQYVNQFFIDSTSPTLTEIYICEDDRSLADSSDRSADGSPGESKEEKSPVPPKEESKKLDSTNLVAAQKPPRTKKARKSDPKPRAVQPHIAIIDSWYEHSDPLFRPAVKSYNRYVKAARALDKAGYTAAEVGAFIDAQQRPYQEWAKLKALSTPKGKTPPPMIMGLEYITQHIAEFAADIRQKARAEAEYQDALRVQNEMRAAMGLTPQAA